MFAVGDLPGRESDVEAMPSQELRSTSAWNCARGTVTLGFRELKAEVPEMKGSRDLRHP